MLKDMKSYCHRKPGQKGTMGLVSQYGTALLCVRYGYDETRGVRLKIVEIVVDEKPWLVPYRKIRGTELEKRIPIEFLNGSRRL